MNIFKQRGNYDPSVMLSSLVMCIGILIIFAPFPEESKEIKEDVIYDAVMDGVSGDVKYTDAMTIEATVTKLGQCQGNVCTNEVMVGKETTIVETHQAVLGMKVYQHCATQTATIGDTVYSEVLCIDHFDNENVNPFETGYLNSHSLVSHPVVDVSNPNNEHIITRY